MLFLLLGVVLVAMKFLEIGLIATWPWWLVLSPFAAAVAWWSWADWSGYTKRKAMEKEEAYKQARIDRTREQLGMSPTRKRRR